MLPMLERSKLMARLDVALKGAMTGRGKFVVLGGEAGIGKSRVANEFLARLPQESIVAIGYGESNGRKRRLGPWFELAGQVTGDCGKALARALRRKDPGPGVVEAIRDAGALVVLALEDMHWADQASLDLIGFIGRRIGTMQALLLVTYRDDEFSPVQPCSLSFDNWSAGSTAHYTFGRLSPKSVEALAARLGQPAGETHALTGGNPFLAITCLEAGTTVTNALPPSLVRLAESRMAKLDPPAQDWTRLAATCPHGLDRDGQHLLAAACGLDLGQMPGGNTLLECRADGRIGFRHEVIRRALLTSMPAARQRQLHGQAFQALAADPGFGGKQPDLLAQLAVLGGMGDEALPFASLAADRAAALGDCGAAERILRLARKGVADCDPLMQAEAHLAWASFALVTCGLLPDEFQALRKASSQMRKLGQVQAQARIDLLRCRTRNWQGWLETSPPGLDGVIAKLEHGDDYSALAHAWAVRGQELVRQGLLEDGKHAAKRAMSLARRAGNSIARLEAWMVMAQALHRLGQSRGCSLAQACMAQAERRGLHMLAAAIRVCQCDEALAERELDAAASCLTPEILEGAPAGWRPALEARLSLVEVLRGRLASGEAKALAVLQSAPESSPPQFHAILAIALARSRQDKADAADWLEKAGALAAASGGCRKAAEVRLAAIEMAFLSGRASKAVELIVQAPPLPVSELDTPVVWEMVQWSRRLGHDLCGAGASGKPCRARRDSRGDWRDRVEGLNSRGLRFEAALSRILDANGDEADGIDLPIAELEGMGAKAAVNAAMRLAKANGFAAHRQKRGPYRASRKHPLGLTRREVEILRLMADGNGNRDIARQLGRSLRTVEHHVSAILGKLNVDSRIKAAVLAMSNPEILGRSNHEG